MNSTLISCYGAALVAGDGRIELFLRAIEAATGERLDYHIPKYVKPKKFSVDRTEYISRWLDLSRDCNPEPVNNGKMSNKMLMANIMNENNILIHAKHQIYGQFEVQCTEPELAYYEAIYKNFSAITAASSAFVAAHWSAKSVSQRGYTKESFRFLMRQAEEDASGKLKPLFEKKRNLYKYELSRHEIVSFAPDGNKIRVSLGWLNYWCDAIAESLKFPDSVRDKPLEGLYERAGGQGWMMKLTADPLDLDMPEHLARLQWAYDRFGIA